MTESKHTPGPWRMGGTSNPDAIGPMQSGLNGGTTILPIAIMGVDLSTNRKGANARLIAAAPDLLAACQHAANELMCDVDNDNPCTARPEREWGSTDAPDCNPCHIRRELWKAISKATGEGN